MEEDKGKKHISLSMAFRDCELPPVHDALVLGKRASVGSNGVVKAMQAMSPGDFELVKVDHPVIEAVLVRESDLRKVPKDKLVNMIIEHAGSIMDEKGCAERDPRGRDRGARNPGYRMSHQ
ncbi:MAG: hypothetical protein GXP49_08300 [Deltaproteobacteria bacterium]|nr:hypothetical protein [Deltaproteobacteria bacterium]